MNIRRLLLAAVPVAAVAVFAFGRQESLSERKWSSVWEGGLITAIAIDASIPSRVYAASARALFVTEDAGGTWSPLPQVGDSFAVTALAIDSGPHAVLYAGTNGGGLLRTAGDRANWVRLSDGPAPRKVAPNSCSRIEVSLSRRRQPCPGSGSI